MIDAVTLIKDKAEALGLDFDFGTKAMTNLLQSTSVSSTKYLILESPLTFSLETEKFSRGKQAVSGRFLLVVKSNIDNVIYRQKGQAESSGKYVSNVLPLLDELDKLYDALVGCSEIEVTSWQAIDGYNLLSTNTDGLIVNFSLKES